VDGKDAQKAKCNATHDLELVRHGAGNIETPWVARGEPDGECCSSRKILRW